MKLSSMPNINYQSTTALLATAQAQQLHKLSHAPADKLQLSFKGSNKKSEKTSLWSRVTHGPAPKLIAGTLLLGLGVSAKLFGLATVLGAPILVPVGLGLAGLGAVFMGWGLIQAFSKKSKSDSHPQESSPPNSESTINPQDKPDVTQGQVDTTIEKQPSDTSITQPKKPEPFIVPDLTKKYTGQKGQDVLKNVILHSPDTLKEAWKDVSEGKPGAEEKLLLFLKSVNNPNIKSDDGTLAIIEALDHKNSKIFNWLFNHPDFNINETGNGRTILTRLEYTYPKLKQDYYQNKKEYAQLLDRVLSHPNLDLRQAGQGDTMREWLARYGNVNQVKQFADAGIDLHTRAKDNLDIIPIENLASRGQLESVRYLLDQRPESLRSTSDHRKMYLLHNAAASGNLELVQMLLDRGAKKMIQDKIPDEKETLLHYAARSNNPAVMELLIKNGAANLINTRDESKHTPLMNAAWYGNVDTMRRLLKAGANKHINSKDHSQLTALHHAARSRNVNTVQLLLNEGALPAINLCDSSGRTPLDHAAHNGDFPSFKLLWKNGADQSFQRRNNSWETILYSAVSGLTSTEIVKFLLENGAASTDNKNLDNRKIGTSYYKPGVSMLDEPEAHSRRPLDAAMYKDNIEVIKLLLQHGANVKYRGEDGDNLLHIAAQRGCSLDILNLLFQHGAQPMLTWTNNKNQTPLDVARESHNEAAIKYFEAHLV